MGGADMRGASSHLKIAKRSVLIGNSGQPKGLSFGFRLKFSVSVGAETFWQNFPFGRKSSCGRNTDISAEILLLFR